MNMFKGFVIMAVVYPSVRIEVLTLLNVKPADNSFRTMAIKLTTEKFVGASVSAVFYAIALYAVGQTDAISTLDVLTATASNRQCCNRHINNLAISPDATINSAVHAPTTVFVGAELDVIRKCYQHNSHCVDVVPPSLSKGHTVGRGTAHAHV